MGDYLELDHSLPLSEQDPMLRLNQLARKKRINFDEAQYYFRSTKRYKQSVQFGDHQVGIVLNEPVLGMIIFNDPHRQDFINISDFDDLNDEALYTVQETLIGFHHGLGVNDIARTFSSFLLAEVHKRNLNPDKQMRVIKQLRQQMVLAEDRSASTTSKFFKDQRILHFSSCGGSAIEDPKERDSVQLGWQCQTE
ncbi:hypothetical protein Tco_0259634 [Tanacetum coccineum]